MAFLRSGNIPGSWHAYYYDSKEKKQKRVPAKVTKAWDGMTREQAEYELDAWVRSNGIEVLRSRRRSVFTDDEINGLITAFIESRSAMGTAEDEAIKAVESNLRTYVLEYFVRTKGCKSVKDWWTYTDTFSVWLRSSYPKQTIETSRKICLNLQAFGEGLARTRVIFQPWLIELPRRKKNERASAPLKNIAKGNPLCRP